MDARVLDRINKSKRKLAKVAAALKLRFVGLDHIIDNIIDNMLVWHAMPELVGRPVIINLWGMTGVGKTDLVRNLAKELDMADRFIEVQMSNKSQTSETSIQEVLNRSAVEPDSQGILLLDEIQRYRTIGNDGCDIHDHDFQDIWMLLSDGRFAGKTQTKTQLMDMLIEDMYWKQRDAENRDEEERNPEPPDIESPVGSTKVQRKIKRKYKMGLWSAREFKRTLRLKEGVDEIMQWDDVKKMEMIESSLSDQRTFEGSSYKQLLIFICGNLDEAYSMSDSTDDADVDADIYYDFSKRINFVTIKRVLRGKFKPEQIARLGNVHIIYPSLSKASYCEIIRRKAQEIIDEMSKYGIDFELDQSVYDAIYRNGVFPAQGVRPVLSSINAMLGNAVPHFYLIAAEHGKSSVLLKHDFDAQELVIMIDGKRYSKPVEGGIDKIKKQFDVDEIMLNSVHEAGHAVAYAVLFRLAPLQVVARSTSSETNSAWVGIHENCRSRNYIRHNICIHMAGLVAEEMIFGEGDRTAGCSSDISQATCLAGYSIRDWAMNGLLSLHVNRHQSSANANFEMDSTNEEIEQALRTAKDDCADILKKNRPLFEAVVGELVVHKKMSPSEFSELAKSHGLMVNIKTAKETVYTRYVDKYNASRTCGVKRKIV